MTPIQHSKNINGTASVVEAISKIQKKCKSPGHYKIQFLTCSCKNGHQHERKKIIKNQRRKQNYETMEPSKKRMLLEKQQVKDTTDKQELLIKKAEKYKAMDTAKKQELLNKTPEKYKTMDIANKQELLNNRAERYKTMNTKKKKQLLRN